MAIHFMECADFGGALASYNSSIQSGVALRLPPHSKVVDHSQKQYGT
jgi:hypothetical protein